MTAAASLAEELVDQLVAPNASDLPPAVMDAAVLRILDTVGVALAGGLTAPASATRSLALRSASASGAAVWGSGRHAPSELAVLANATAAHALDYDDANYDAIMHAGALVVPVALAVGEELASTGSEVLSAVATGYQVGSWLGKRAFRRFQPRGFHSTSVLGVFAGVAVAGRLRKLAPKCFVDAFGICGSMASGVMEFLKSGGDTKPLQVGWAARSALAAVALAEAGASGPSTVLEGEYGIFRSFAGTRVELGEAVPPLWDGYAICTAATKFYEVCGAIHGPAEGWRQVLAQLRSAGEDPVEDLVSVTCTLSDFAARLVCYPEDRKYRPATAHEARFSLAWCLARLALDGEITEASFADEVLFDPRGLDLAARVDYRVLDPSQEKATLAIVEATARSGRRYRVVVDPSAREGGAPERVLEKVRRAVATAGWPEEADHLIAAAQALDAGASLELLSSVLDRIVCGGTR